MTDNIESDLGRTNYPPNSKISKEKLAKSSKGPDAPEDAKPKIEQVTSKKAVQRKKGFWKKTKDAFTSEDSQTVGSYIVWEVLVPALQSMIYEAGSQGLERALFGEVRARGSRSSSSRTPYDKMYGSTSRRDRGRDDDRRPRREISSRARSSHDFGEIVLDSRGEAEEVLDRLTYLIEQFDVASVNDLYDLVGITGSFQDEKWGWTDLRDAKARPVHGGYLLVLPRTEPLD